MIKKVNCALQVGHLVTLLRPRSRLGLLRTQSRFSRWTRTHVRLGKAVFLTASFILFSKLLLQLPSSH